jgi:hypothetical protein
MCHCDPVLSSQSDDSKLHWVQWTPGLHVHTISWRTGVVGPGRSTLPNPLTRDGASVRRGRSERRHPYKVTGSDLRGWTQWDSNPRHPPCKGGTLPLSYEPTRPAEPTETGIALALVVRRCPIARPGRVGLQWYEQVSPPQRGGSRTLGGDPAADSPTATLLRLKPPCEAQIRPRNVASSGPHSGALTGGVCKEQGRIHRALLTRDYYRIQLHADEFQSAIRTTSRFLRLPPPLGVGTHCPAHCSPRVAQPIRGILTYRCPFLPPL